MSFPSRMIEVLQTERRKIYLTPVETRQSRAQFLADMGLLEDLGVLETLKMTLGETRTLLCEAEFPKHPRSGNITPFAVARWNFERATAFVDFYPELTYGEMRLVPDSRTREISVRGEKYSDRKSLLEMIESTIRGNTGMRNTLFAREIREGYIPPFPGERQIFPSTPFRTIMAGLPRKTFGMVCS